MQKLRSLVLEIMRSYLEQMPKNVRSFFEELIKIYENQQTTVFIDVNVM